VTRARKHKTPLRPEWRFAFLRWSLASRAIEGGGYFHRACYRFSGRLPLRWRLALAGACCSLAGLDFSGSRYITGTHNIAICGPFDAMPVFNSLRISKRLALLILELRRDRESRKR
jgi:hypothetical protein